MHKFNEHIFEQRRFFFIPTLATGIFLILLIRIYWEPTLLDNIPKGQYSNDWTEKQYALWGPIWRYGFDHLKRGEIPHWNPYQACGHPYLVEIRTALFQPIHLLFWYLDFPYAYQAHIFLSSFLIGMGFLIWARILNLPYSAIIIGLTSLLTTGPFLWCQMSLNFLSGAVWLMLLLVGLSYSQEIRTLRSYFVLLIIWILLILSGSIECIFTGAILMVSYPHISRFISPLVPRPGLWKNALITLGISILGLAITAFSWLPWVLWVWESNSINEFLYSTPQMGDYPKTFMEAISQLIIPFTSFEGRSGIPVVYLGVLPLLFMGTAFFDREKRTIAYVHLCIILSFFILYLTNNLILLCFQRGLILYYSVSCSILLGLGVNRVLFKGRELRSPYVWASSSTVLLLALLCLFCGSIWHKGVAITLIIILIPGILIRWHVFRFLIAVGIAFLIFLDNFVTLRTFLPENYITAINSKEAYSDIIHKVRYQTGTGRSFLLVSPDSILWSDNLGMQYQWRLINGIHLPLPERAQQWFNAIQSARNDVPTSLASPFLRISQIHWLCATQPLPIPESEVTKWRKMEVLSNLYLYENLARIPRCFVVPRYTFVSDYNEALQHITSDKYETTKECVLEKPFYGGTIPQIPNGNIKPTQIEEGIPASCVIQEETDEKIIISVKTEIDGILVLLDTYSPGWKASIDGSEVPIFIANGIFRGVFLTKGDHIVTFEYTTPGWYIGLHITLFSIVLTFIIILLVRIFGADTR